MSTVDKKMICLPPETIKEMNGAAKYLRMSFSGFISYLFKFWMERK